MKKSIISSSSLQTKIIAKALAETVLESKSVKNARVIALAGDLGSGKTTFTQGFAQGLGVKEKILSPTFILIRSYPLDAKRYTLFYHIDCYRLDNPVRELLHLGWKEIIGNPRHIVLVEWGDKIRSILPRGVLWVSFFQKRKSLTRRIVMLG